MEHFAIPPNSAFSVTFVQTTGHEEFQSGELKDSVPETPSIEAYEPRPECLLHATVIVPGSLTSPVGISTFVPIGSRVVVQSQTSAVGYVTCTAVAANCVPENETTTPVGVKAAINYDTTRKVAEPRTRSPTDAVRLLVLIVAVPENEIGPLIWRAPLSPAVRILLLK